jgi:hypothetical protein
MPRGDAIPLPRDPGEGDLPLIPFVDMGGSKGRRFFRARALTWSEHGKHCPWMSEEQKDQRRLQ